MSVLGLAGPIFGAGSRQGRHGRRSRRSGRLVPAALGPESGAICRTCACRRQGRAGVVVQWSLVRDAGVELPGNGAAPVARAGLDGRALSPCGPIFLAIAGTMGGMKSLRNLMLGSGRLPDDLRAASTAEGLLFLEEGLSGSITYRNYRAPGQRSSLNKQATTDAIVVTSRRLIGWAAGGKNIDVPLDHSLRAAINITLDRPDRICFAYDAGKFSTERSGTIEVRLRTARAAQVAELLKPKG